MVSMHRLLWDTFRFPLHFLQNRDGGQPSIHCKEEEGWDGHADILSKGVMEVVTYSSRFPNSLRSMICTK